jgi:hypothetical protein
MKEAGVTSVFVLIEKDASSRGVISREALRFGYTPTFLEVEPELIKAKKSLLAAEKYMKEEFIYLPANRLIPGSELRLLVKLPVNSHQVASLLFTGKQHPQLNKPSIHRVEYNRESNLRVSGEQGAAGYDMGVYKCGTIVFKLIDKVSQSRGFSWNRLQTALTRAGRSLVVPTQNSYWAVIESQEDIPLLERLRATETVNKLPINEIDKAALGGLYAKMYPLVAGNTSVRQQGSLIWILLVIIGCGLLVSDSGLVNIMGGIVASLAVATFPLIEYLSAGTSLTRKLKPVVLSALRTLVITVLSLAALQSFGLGGWILLSLLLLGIEIFLLMNPIVLIDDKVERVFQSFLVHAALLLLASVFVLPILMLVIFGSLTALMGLLKGHQAFREFQREKHS